MNKMEQGFLVRLRLWWIIAISLGWVLLVRDPEIFQSLSTLPRNAVFAGLITFFSWLYRDTIFECQLTAKDVIIFLVALGSLSLVNWHVLLQALACDELYHAGMASQSVIAIEKMSGHGDALSQYMKNRPMTEMVSILNFGVLLVSLFIGWIAKKISLLGKTPKLRDTIAFVILFLVLIMVGQIFRSFPHRAEIHPPLRLLPLFLAQLIFGYDDFVFRMVSTAALAAMTTLGVSYVARKSKDQSAFRVVRLLIAFLAFTSPTLLHAASIVEPSIFVYCSWIGVFFTLAMYFEASDDRFLVATGIVIALGSLARQNAMVLWGVLGLVLLFKRPKWQTWVKTLAPATWFLPLFFHLLTGNHPAKSDHPIQNVVDSIVSGKSFFIVFNQTTPPWILLAVALLSLFMIHGLWKKEPAALVCLAVFPAYILYFSISPYLWPLGRYQAEWISPVIGVLALVVAAYAPKPSLRALTPVAVMLMLFSGYTVHELHRDAYYSEWPLRRITSESMFPYRQAFGHLQQAPQSGSFTFTYGVPIYGEWLFYLRGYSYGEVEIQRTLQSKWQGIVEKSKSWADLVRYANSEHIRYAVLQSGNKREVQHRAGWQNNAESMLRSASETPNSGLIKRDSYTGDLEGNIDVFEFIPVTKG